MPPHVLRGVKGKTETAGVWGKLNLTNGMMEVGWNETKSVDMKYVRFPRGSTGFWFRTIEQIKRYRKSGFFKNSIYVGLFLKTAF